MSLSAKAFWICIFFIGGASLYASGVHLLHSFLITCMLILVFLFAYIAQKSRAFLALSIVSLCICAGSVYAYAYESYLLNNPFDARVSYELQGIIASVPRESGSSQRFVLRTDRDIRVLIKTDALYQLAYGDTLLVQGRMTRDTTQESYLRKARAAAQMDFPRIVRAVPAREWSVARALVNAQQSFSRILSLILPRDEAALSSGLLLGRQGADFSRDLQDAMKRSGTTHIVALSGFNISLLIAALGVTLGMFLPRKAAFWIGLGCVTAFVVMTGAEASVVRAALMGSLLLAAQRVSRPFSIRHAMALAAMGMILWNPFVMIADIGFTLSFAALLGIAYLSPAVCALFRPGEGWRGKIIRIACDTVCAQVAVLPIIASQFGAISAVGIVSNIIILPLIPYTMGLAFFAGVIGLLAIPAAQLAALPLGGLVGFQIGIIRLFGMLPSFSFSMPLGAGFAYYAVLILLYVLLRRAASRCTLRFQAV